MTWGRPQFTVHKFGLNLAVPTNAYETVWSGSNLYDGWLAAEEAVDLVSANAGDTGDVDVQGLNGGALQSEVVTMTGDTPKRIAKEYSRIFRMRYLDADTLGAITATSVTTSKVMARIEIGATTNGSPNQTQMAIYTVPAGFNGYVQEIRASTFGNINGMFVGLWARAPLETAWQQKHLMYIRGAGTSALAEHFGHEVTDGLMFPAGTDLELRALSETNPGPIAGTFEITMRAA